MSDTIWLSAFSTVSPSTMHHLVFIPSGAPHHARVALRKARHLSLGAWGQTSGLCDWSWLWALSWLTTTPLLHVGTAHRSQSSQLLTFGQTLHIELSWYVTITHCSKLEHHLVLFSGIFLTFQHLFQNTVATASEMMHTAVVAPSCLSDTLLTYLGITLVAPNTVLD